LRRDGLRGAAVFHIRRHCEVRSTEAISRGLAVTHEIASLRPQ